VGAGVNAWGNAWGRSWGYSWGSASPAVFYPVGGYPEERKKKLIEVEHEGKLYEFENEEDARELVESIAQEFEPTPREIKKGKTTPTITFRVNNVPVVSSNMRGYSPVRAVLDNRFDMIYAAARKAQDEDDEEALLLLM